MRKIFQSLLLIGVYHAHVIAQSATKQNDSAVVRQYFQKAFHCHTFAHQRQAYLDTILTIQPNNAYAWQQKAMPLFKQKKYELGMRYLDSAVKFDNGYMWLEYRAFIKCVFQKSYRAAISDLNLADKRNPGGFVQDHSYDFWRGLSYLQLNRFDSAAFFISKSVVAGEKRARIGHYLEYMYLGIVQMEQHDYEAAIKTFDKALATYVHFSDAKYYKALCLNELGKDEAYKALLADALKDLKTGYTINEDNVIYEEYPYQLKRYWIENKLKY